MSLSIERNILVANKVARILGVLTFALLAMLIFSFGVSINTPVIFSLVIFFFSIPYIHKKGYVNLGRALLCLIPVVVTIAAALFAKIYATSFTDILYYDSRFVLLIITIVPCLIFDTTERPLLYGCLGTILAAIILFDPIHELFNVGYYQKGFLGSSYYFINVFTIIGFAGIAIGAISQKRVIEKTEYLNQVIKNDLINKNKELSTALNNLEKQNKEILSQNEEIRTHREELYSSQEQLVAANKLIEKQNLELKRQVNYINEDLKITNEELIKQNNNLRQFSYTVSHNLRGPIARLLGLSRLAEMEAETYNNIPTMAIISHIKKSARDLDIVIRDLNQLIDLQNATNLLRQQVNFMDEWSEIKSLLHITHAMEEQNFHIDFSEAPTVMSVKSMVNSILFNLVSNAIKYQCEDRPLLINIRTYPTGLFTTIEVSDNGLGINLQLYGEDVFKMYKRFHEHKEGKGLGLFLVNTQAKVLGGYAELISELGKGSTFKIHVKS